MFYRVNDKCIGCGMCEGICPEVFKIMPDGFAIAKKDVPDGAHNSAEEARESCPVGAIEKEWI